tara:strand:+ start:28 stop:156 length:129 start_codon:yes stop_codon:yes gene_type:complete
MVLELLMLQHKLIQYQLVQVVQVEHQEIQILLHQVQIQFFQQ